MSNTVSIKCKCGRNYWATKAYAKKVEKKLVENECGYCDNSHNDGENDDTQKV